MSKQPPKASKLLNDCFLHDKERLPHHEALEILKERLVGITSKETVNIGEAQDKILAEDIRATRNIPSTDNSAVDGYAYRASDFDDAGGFFLIAARIAAGDINPSPLPQWSAVRIFTGAVMPEGADTIAMQEDCETHAQEGTDFVVIPQGLKPGANRRRMGEDLMQGDLIAKVGEQVTPQLIAAIASTGQSKVEVYSPLRIAILSSGNELKEPGQTAQAGQVFDSNRYLLQSLLKMLPVEITDLGIQPDNYDVIETKLAEAAKTNDIVISSGGASLGEEDHIIAALEKLGTRHLWQLAVKPGRPMSFGQIGDTLFFGLPGNPVACFVCFLLYVRPSLLRLAGADWHEPKRFKVPALFDFNNKKPDRREFWRGIYAPTDGAFGLEKFARDGSGLITGLRKADGLIEIPEAVTNVSKGDLLDFIPWSEFGI